MSKIKTIIIEDEAAIQKELNWLVMQRSDEFEIHGMATNVKDAIILIEKEQPQLVLMDIQLGDGMAFDILNQLKTISFQIIFITAYNQFAINAIKVGAFDYLLKPINEDELSDVLDRIIIHFKSNTENDSTTQFEFSKKYLDNKSLDISDMFCVSSTNHLQMLEVGDVNYCESNGAYTILHLNNGKTLTATKTLKYFEELLPEKWFVRIHQSYLVNKKSIDKILKSGTLFIKTGEELPIAGRRKESVLEQMKGFRG